MVLGGEGVRRLPRQHDQRLLLLPRYALFEDCASGPAIPHGLDCDDRDFDNDTDDDQDDFAAFQLCISGEDVTADPTCAD